MDKKILIVGAGICGLMTAKNLLKAGKRVLILEAKERTGGRIQTIQDKFSFPVDAGAEFIHGNLPLTLALLKEAGIAPVHRAGKIYRSEEKTIYASDNFVEDLELVLSKLKHLHRDVPLSKFLLKNKLDNKTKVSVINFAEGFDAADVNRISSFSVRDEWEEQDPDTIMQIENGHARLIKYLTDHCMKHGCKILLSSEVNEVHWKRDQVKIFCADRHTFEAEKAVITIPLGVLTLKQGAKGYINFIPSIPEKKEAADKIGYGSVIKIIFEFKTAFWLVKNYGGEEVYLPELGFLISEDEIPVWWTHTDRKAPILTGWLGGPKADTFKNNSEEEILKKAISSLAQTLKVKKSFLQEQLYVWAIYNWGADPFSRGAYAYETVESKTAKKIMNKPLSRTLYFAGEALNEGESIGTVEAAIESAEKTAEKILLDF